jgi:Cytochrome P450
MTAAIGPVSTLWLGGLFARDPVRALQWTYNRYGRLAVADMPLVRKPQRFIFAVGAQYNERVLSDPTTFHTVGLMPPGPENSAQRRIRSGVISMNGGRHAHYRRMMLPPFRRGIVDRFVEQITTIVEQEMSGWPLGETIDLVPLLNEIARNVALVLLFGSDMAEGLKVAGLLTNHIRMAEAPAVRGCPINWPGMPYRRMLRHAEKVETSVTSWAARRRGQVRADDLLSLIVNSPDESGNLPTDEQVSRHVLTLFAASFETCQTALAWTLFFDRSAPIGRSGAVGRGVGDAGEKPCVCRSTRAIELARRRCQGEHAIVAAGAIPDPTREPGYRPDRLRGQSGNARVPQCVPDQPAARRLSRRRQIHSATMGADRAVAIRISGFQRRPPHMHRILVRHDVPQDHTGAYRASLSNNACPWSAHR